MEFLSAPDYWIARFLFQRGLGAIYLIAFLVVANQFRALCGENGLLPASRFLDRAGFRRAPSLFHWWPADRTYAVAAWSGVAVSVLALTGTSDAFGLGVSIAVWALLWVLYLSFVNAGQIFYGYGWESLLLETGFLAIFLGPSEMEPSWITVWLLRWVLFRVMFGAALIKLRGDPCWRDLTCLDYHYETQPLPNPLSWLLHRSPTWFHKLAVLFTHGVQLGAPGLALVPGPVGVLGGIAIVLFQLTLVVSGNLSWLNWLTMLLAVACFDDAILSSVVPLEHGPLTPRPLAFDLALLLLALLVLVKSVEPVKNLLSKRQMMNASFDPLHLVNTYGAFGSVTRERYEVILEGTSGDGEWRTYEFKAKPGDPSRPPAVVAPYHLRLDWQIWFAAMRPRASDAWFLRFVEELLNGNVVVSELLAEDPFPDQPPRQIRARRYLYRFTTLEEKRETGRWWHREHVGEYLHAVTLEDFSERTHRRS